MNKTKSCSIVVMLAILVVANGSFQLFQSFQSLILMMLNISIAGLGWSFPCDIWSVGCILVELCSVRSLLTLLFFKH
jgi:hypothetical protein